jgi:hypothetical protein
VTSVNAHGIIESFEAFVFALIARVDQPAEGLEKNGGTQIFLAVPPVRGTGCAATGAENAFVETVELAAISFGLSVFFALTKQLETILWIAAVLEAEACLQMWSRRFAAK